jgi:hypothetical protein
MPPRELFTDGWNSLWHFMFGVVGFYFGWVVLLFFAYQLNTPMDTNVVIDISEFAIGYLVIWTTTQHPLFRKTTDWLGKIRLLTQ